MTRFFVIAALCVALLNAHTPVSAQSGAGRPVIHAQGNPYHVDFVARQSKRGDLRANVARLGLDTAFSQWLAAEHPDAYRDAAAHSTARGANPLGQVTARSTRAAGSCCVMARGCCSLCPTCCEQKSCAKGCCNLAACINRPACCS